MKPFVEARALHYAVRGVHIVADATLSLFPGRLVVIVGPNGAGKSTLLKLLSGELHASSGEVSCCGEPLRRIPAWLLARRRAVMAQATQLAFPFTVEEVVRIGLDTLGVDARGEAADEIIARALRRADISNLARRKYDTLSGGEQQRTHFARVLCQLAAGRRSESCQALFLDEPAASLDIRHQLTLMDAAREIADSGVAVLAILHDLNLAAAYADQLVVMRAGKLVASGDPAKVLAGGLLSEVFGVHLRLCAAPPKAAFILPHGHARRIAWSQPAQTALRRGPLDNLVCEQGSEPYATLPENENASTSFSFWP